MDSETRKRYNAKLVGILDKIIDICETNNIHWFVSYGACIGAVRHKGCIPWDDDIDICMPRPDYDRFVEICRSSDMGEYELATMDDTPDYIHYFRVYDKNSTILFNKWTKHVGGIFIDVFPLDGAADGKIRGNFMRFRFWQIVSHYSHARFTKTQRIVLLKKCQLHKYFLAIISSLFGDPLQRISLRKIEKTIRKYSYEESEFCVFYVNVYGMRNVIPKKWVEETIFVQFEDTQVRIPKFYHEYLSQIYGDYMTPPPVEKRDDRHVFAFLDLDKRWSLDDILKELSKE